MNSSYKKCFIILVLLLLTSILASCTGAREIDTLGIVIVMGIDIEDGKIIVTNEVKNPVTGRGTENENTSNEEPTLFVQGIGDTLADAVADTRLTFDKELYYPHNQLIILGEEIAKQGFEPYIDILSRNHEQREEAIILIAKDSKAYEVMGIDGGISMSPGDYIYGIVEDEAHDPMTRSLIVSDLFKYYYREPQGITIGAVQAVKKPEIGKSKSNSNSNSKYDVISVSGGAVFKKDKLIGYFSEDEMVGFNFIVDQMKSSIINFKTPKDSDKNTDYIIKGGEFSSFNVFKNKTKRKINLVDNKLHLSIDVVTNGKLGENAQGIDLTKPEVVKAMEKACAEEIESIISKTMDKAQKEFNVDTFSISTRVHRKYPKLWKEIEDSWDGIFMDLDYTVNAKVHFQDVGLTNTPANIRKDQ